jgi:hypothetical protein
VGRRRSRHHRGHGWHRQRLRSVRGELLLPERRSRPGNRRSAVVHHHGIGTNSFAVQILDSANTVLQQATFNPTSNAYRPNWLPFSTTTAPLIAGTYKVLLIGQANGFDDDYGVDNIAATAVAPEPGTLALLGLVGIPGVALLRRKK